MEADWEVEVGPGAPIIEAFWEGFVDLRNAPDRVAEIAEAAAFPALSKTLHALNERGSNGSCRLPQVWTSKCDVWSIEECDPDEMNSEPEEAVAGLACYVDLLPRTRLVFGDLDEAEVWCKEAVHRLKMTDGINCRVDLVIRQAVAGDVEGLGITAYVSGCGSNSGAARQALGGALEAFASAICD